MDPTDWWGGRRGGDDNLNFLICVISARPGLELVVVDVKIGLAPICSIDSRPLLASHKDCLMKLADQANGDATNCQSGLSGIGNSVGMMMQGIHGEALLCKSFYLIRDTFTCGEKAVQQQCDANALRDLGTLKRQ
ncbi:hypothetical protein TELCIR_22954, partial [Teladorsagia circumcincta]